MTSGSTRSALFWRGFVIAACAGACVGLADVARALSTSRREMLQARDAFEVTCFYVAFLAPCGLVAA
jgi:hypothetical protein